MVEHFDRNAEAYRSGNYSEAQLRQEFLNPFFWALGWDVENRQGFAEAYKDVIHEDSVKIEGETKAPDYSFRIGETRKFFVEAKKPSINLKEDPRPAFQLRRYAWTVKLPLSLLTSFAELAVYDCRVQPFQSDKASTARISYYTYPQYLEQWDELAGRFSKDAVWKGSFDRFIESTRAKKGTAEVDEAFLKEIEEWRKELASNIALRNPKLTQREVNFAVQRTIDRIIFLRICEDRGIEKYGQLRELQREADVYRALCTIFERADERYNSGLFHFNKEKDRAEEPDELTLRLKLDDAKLKAIFRRLYYPESSYEFSVLPADILGQVYEQFLGKVIHLTAGHFARVEDKPEVKKAGGVYYTPTYIVDYIVKNTVGKLLEGKTPKQAAKLRILDPACGSGSFLIAAYQYLLNWHRDRCLEEGAEKHRKELYQSSGGTWRLTISEKKRILRNNIYGVDIDAQAVEVTKLSLLLKVLEGESEQTLNTTYRMFHERALPDLGENIKCGNSLIGPDVLNVLKGGQMNLLDDEDRYRINAFPWTKEFGGIMQCGGFDVVIGNPPYLRIQTMKEWAPTEVEFYKQCYRTAQRGNYDIYVVFVEKGLELLNPQGKLGFILPNKFFNAEYGAPLRGLISAGRHLRHVVHFDAQQVFQRSTTYTCLMFLDKAGVKSCDFVKVDDLPEWRISGRGLRGEVSRVEVTEAEWNFTVGPEAALVAKLRSITPTLGDIADVFVGLQTSADDVFILDLVAASSKSVRLFSKSLGREWIFEPDLFFPLVSGTDIKRYGVLPRRQFILFPYSVRDSTAELLDFDLIERKYPKTAAYLSANKKRLESRERGKFRGGDWYRFGRSQNLGIQGRVKLCVPRLVEALHGTYDSQGEYFLDNVDVGGLTLKPAYEHVGLLFLLGLINSRLMVWYFPHVSASFRGGWFSANRQFLSKLPIRMFDTAKKTSRIAESSFARDVTAMLDMHKRLLSLRTDQERNAVQRHMDATSRQIDKLVYGLYGLTDEEIAIVEGSAQAAAASA